MRDGERRRERHVHDLGDTNGWLSCDRLDDLDLLDVLVPQPTVLEGPDEIEDLGCLVRERGLRSNACVRVGERERERLILVNHGSLVDRVSWVTTVYRCGTYSGSDSPSRRYACTYYSHRRR